MNELGLTTAQLLTVLKPYGVNVDQLDRFRRDGSISGPIGASKSGGRGRPQLIYPREALSQCLALIGVHPRPKDPTKLEFEAWWNSGVTPARGARQVLLEAIYPITRFCRRLFRDSAAAGEDGFFEMVERIANAAYRTQVPIVKLIRRNLAAGADAVNTVIVALVQLTFGRADVIAVDVDAADEPTAQNLVWHALELEEASRPVAGIDSWLKDDVHAIGRDFVAAATAGLFRFDRYPNYIAVLTDAEIEQARKDARVLSSDLPDVLDSICLRLGPKAFGFGFGALALRLLGSSTGLKAMAVVAISQMRKLYGENVDNLLAVARQNAPGARVWIAVAKKFPNIRPLLRIENYHMFRALPRSKLNPIATFIRNHPDGSSVVSAAGC